MGALGKVSTCWSNCKSQLSGPRMNHRVRCPKPRGWSQNIYVYALRTEMWGQMSEAARIEPKHICICSAYRNVGSDVRSREFRAKQVYLLLSLQSLESMKDPT